MTTITSNPEFRTVTAASARNARKAHLGLLSVASGAAHGVASLVVRVFPLLRGKYTHHAVFATIIAAGLVLGSFEHEIGEFIKDHLCDCLACPCEKIVVWLPDFIKEIGAAPYVEAAVRLFIREGKEVVEKA